MVGQRFMENLLEDAGGPDHVQLATFCAEPRAAYNRVKLTTVVTLKHAIHPI
jgi:NAD(P)H-nitrite reductase large subunit